MLSIQREICGLRAALTADVPNEYTAPSRAIFLNQWFRSKVGRHIGRTIALYAIAQAIGLSTAEIWRWKGFIYGEHSSRSGGRAAPPDLRLKRGKP